MKASRMLRLERLLKAVKHAKRVAARGTVYYGKVDPDALAPYKHTLQLDGFLVSIIFSRDGGHHSGGWFKNPDYERCYHLSLGFFSPAGEPQPQETKLARELVELFYGEHARWVWVESPKYKHRTGMDVWHYRLFTDEHWRPILPRKEVYSKEFTEIGWKSFSEIHGHKPVMAQEA